MVRSLLVAAACVAVGLVLFAQPGVAGDANKVKQKQNQMVKGTIKSVDVSKDVLVINQKVKNEVVDRELSILDTTEFVVMGGAAKKEAVGNAGLRLLEGKEGSQVQVRCDKDVNVLKVTVTLKK